jgi:hypothetical protein
MVMATKRNIRPTSEGYGQIWTKDEIELMLNLEIQFQGERDMANKMYQYLHNKTNKQIRDKRAKSTCMNQWRELDPKERAEICLTTFTQHYLTTQ